MNNKEGTKDRLLTFISYLRIRKSEFERRCSLSNGYINSIKGDIGLQKLMNMTSAFPQLNPYWVATGKGEMIRAVGSQPHSFETAPEHQNDLMTTRSNRELSFEEKYDQLLKILTEIQQRDEFNQNRIATLSDTIKMKEDQINRLLHLVDKLNYNHSTQPVELQ